MAVKNAFTNAPVYPTYKDIRTGRLDAEDPYFLWSPDKARDARAGLIQANHTNPNNVWDDRDVRIAGLRAAVTSDAAGAFKFAQNDYFKNGQQAVGCGSQRTIRRCAVEHPMP